MNVANIFAVGLASGLIGAAIAYFVLIRSADFQWWWVFILFGAQFLSVIVVAYVLQKSLKFNNMFCEAPVLVADNCDWNSLFAAPASGSKLVVSDCSLSANQSIGVNSPDWQDLVQQLDQMSKLPLTAGVAVSDVATCVSAAIKIAGQSAPAAPLPEPPMFDFAAIASGLATPAPATVMVPVVASTPILIPAKAAATTSVSAPVIAPATTATTTAPTFDFSAIAGGLATLAPAAVTAPVVASTPILTPAKTAVTMPAVTPIATFAPTQAPTVIPAKAIVSSPTPVVTTASVPVPNSVIAAAPPPTVTSVFDFSAMACTLATPAPAPTSIPAKAATTPATVPVTTVAPAPILAKVVTTTPPPVPVVPVQTTSSIDFAALFR